MNTEAFAGKAESKSAGNGVEIKGRLMHKKGIFQCIFLKYPLLCAIEDFVLSGLQINSRHLHFYDWIIEVLTVSNAAGLYPHYETTFHPRKSVWIKKIFLLLSFWRRTGAVLEVHRGLPQHSRNRKSSPYQ